MFLVDRASMYYYHEETDHLPSLNFLLGFPSIELPACLDRTADDYLSYMQRPWPLAGMKPLCDLNPANVALPNR
jgi:hypothetical protein